MQRRWPPEPTPSNGEADLSRLAELHASVLARYWDDDDSDESNFELIGWWLAHSERERRLP